MLVLNGIQENIVRKVITLADDYRLIYNKYAPQGGSLKELAVFQASEEYKLVKEKYSLLSDYLMGLSIDEVIMVQTVMYIGRDERGSNISDASTLYKEVYDDLYERKNTKSIEVNQITQKMPLADYLRDGLIILK